MTGKIVAQVTRSDGWWAVRVPEIPGLFTQARRLDQVESQVVDAAKMLDIDVESVEVVPLLGGDKELMLKEAIDTRAESERLQKRASELTRGAVVALKSDGFTVRDIASLLGLSPQRVSVLSNSGK